MQSNFEICDIKDHCYHDSLITKFKTSYGKLYGIAGEFPEDETERTGLRYFSYMFEPHIDKQFPKELIDCNYAEIYTFDIKPVGNSYKVRLYVSTAPPEHDFFPIEFTCKNVRSNLYRYLDMSYRNIYEETVVRYHKDSKRIIIDENFEDETVHTLTNEHTLIFRSYTEEKYDGNRLLSSWRMGKYILCRKDTPIYESICFDDHFGDNEQTVIQHRNGHRYLPFHTDLYGLSYIDIDTLEVYHYIPEGRMHDYRTPVGESFIIVNAHYDHDTNLVAYTGCLWGCPNNVYVGDLSEPLNYNPHLVDIHELIDYNYAEFDDVDFVRWDTGELIVKADRGQEYHVSINEIKNKIVELNNNDNTVRA